MFFTRLTRWVFEHLVVAWTLVATVMVVLSLGIAQLKINLSFEAFVGGKSIDSMNLQKHITAWDNADRFAFIVVTPSEKLSLLSRESLLMQDHAIQMLEALDAVQEVIGLPKLPVIDVNTAFSAPTMLTLSEQHSTEELQKMALDDDELTPRFLAKDFSATAILLELDLDTDDVQAFGVPVREIRGVLDELNKQETGKLHFELAGVPAVRADFVQLLIHDQSVFVTLAMLLCLSIVAFSFRSWHGVLVPCLVAIVPTIELFGFMGWSHEPIGILSLVFATLIPVIAIADTMHVLTRFHQLAHQKYGDGWSGFFNDDKERDELIVEVMSHVGLACLLTSVTTAVGFLSLAIADMSVLVHFGIYAGVGVTLAFFNFIVLVPLLLRFTKRVPPRPARRSLIEKFLEKSVGVSLSHPVVVVLVGTGVAIGSGLAARNVSLDNRINDVLGPEHSVTKANATLDAKLSGVVSIHVDIESENGLLEPNALAAIADFERWAKAQPEVRCFEGPASRISLAAKLALGTSSLPQTKASIAQVLLLVDGNVPFDDVLKGDHQSGRVVLHIADLGGVGVEQFRSKLQPASTRFLDDKGIQTTLTGVSYVAYLSFNRISRELGKGLLSALLIILILIAFLFRKLSWGILALVPNALPLLATLGFMGLFQWRLDPPSTIVFVVGLGIAVDDTIHLLARIKQENKRHSLSRSLQIAVVSTGKAVTMTSIVLVIGFGINGFSSFPMNAVFGVLGALAIAMAWVCDVHFLPAFWILFSTDDAQKSPEQE
ncbi:MAG: MMPL family transporter [Deltaproteobacteria bacterium]|nr:MMPL family transporter [Deltaproteobacteria bacterium]